MRSVLITGTSVGFGLLATVELAKRGWRVIATMRNLERKGALEAALAQAGAAANVDIVQLDLDWIRRLHSLLDLLRRSLWVVMSVLGLGVLAVIGNTIRLEIQQRRAEIEVTKLVGGSNAFVRRPFLYTGIFTAILPL